MWKLILFTVMLSTVSCSNAKEYNQVNFAEKECIEFGGKSKQCEIYNLKDYTDIEKTASLGVLYLFGFETTAKNYEKAYIYLKNAAEHDNTEAMNGVGIIYLYGLGREVDLKAAEKYFNFANNLGDKDAKNNLGELYRIKNDNATAEYWFKLAINDYPYKAYEGLSKIYIEQGDYKEAYEYTVKATELNNVEAEYNLGVFYEKGIYVQKDIQKAIFWYKKAAKQGHKDAINNLNVIASLN